MEHIGYARINKQIVKLDNGMILPLVNDFGQSLGVIYIESKNFEEGEKLLEIYANQVASSLNNAFLHSRVNIKNEELKKTYEDLRTGYLETIEVLRLAVDARDFYTRGHSDRVSYYSLKIGQALKLTDKQCEILRLGGIFHDIGKIGTSDDILLKSGKLTEKEYQEIKKHPLKGAHILAAISVFQEVVPLVKYHHERPDGRGYPEGLKDHQIPFSAKILAVADAFDAMSSDRLYRSKLQLTEVKKELINGSGCQFEPEIVNVFMKLLDNFEQMTKEVAFTYEEHNLDSLRLANIVESWGINNV
jgi:putative nucleotidyltransferase with HDIG domain